MSATPEHLTDFLLARIAEDDRPGLMLAIERKMIERVERGDGDASVLRVLARRYADHPDYREEWRA